MTEQDRKIQRLRQDNSALRQEIKRLTMENTGLREEINLIMATAGSCAFCAHIHEDCTPGRDGCVPEWRGLNHG